MVAAAIAAATTTANGLTAHADANDANGGWKTATVTEADTTGEGAVWQVGTEYVAAGKTKAMDSDGKHSLREQFRYQDASLHMKLQKMAY